MSGQGVHGLGWMYWMEAGPARSSYTIGSLDNNKQGKWTKMTNKSLTRETSKTCDPSNSTHWLHLAPLGIRGPHPNQAPQSTVAPPRGLCHHPHSRTGAHNPHPAPPLHPLAASPSPHRPAPRLHTTTRNPQASTCATSGRLHGAGEEPATRNIAHWL